MSRFDRSVFYIARITLESLTPLSIGSGLRDAVFDSPIVTDANGLPVIPGTALAGVLRQAISASMGEAVARQLFGFAGDESATSCIEISFGHIHSAENIPMDGLKTVAEIEADPILQPLLQQLPHRDMVKLNHRGVATDTGKFDRTMVPVGHRFTFELAYWSASDNDPHWQTLLAIIASPTFRLGGAIRRGLGAFRIIRVESDKFQLHNADDTQRFTALPRNLAQPLNGQVQNVTERNRPHCVAISIEISPVDYWMIGGGQQALQPENKADKVTITESIIEWIDHRAHPSTNNDIVLPASAIKGAIRHRLAYHYYRLSGEYADGKPDPTLQQMLEQCPAAIALFGQVPASKKQGKAVAGAVLIDDVRIKRNQVTPQTIQHNSIDRFTGGTRNGVLFSEEMLWQGPKVGFSLLIDKQALNRADVAVNRPHLFEALRRTLNDLTEERLAIGHGMAKGHGYFAGSWNTNALQALMEDSTR